MIVIPVKDQILNFEETEFGLLMSELEFLGMNPTKTGPWIAGGSVLKTFLDMPLGNSDIDIFPASMFQLTKLERLFKDTLEKESSDVIMQPSPDLFKQLIQRTTEYSVTFKLPYTFNDEDKERKVQFVKLNVEKHINNKMLEFDINVCRIYFDGVSFILNEETLKSINRREMNIDSEFVTNPFLSLNRLMKYSALGFKVTQSSIKEFFRKFFKEEYVKKLEEFESLLESGIGVTGY